MPSAAQLVTALEVLTLHASFTVPFTSRLETLQTTVPHPSTVTKAEFATL